jgi:hypothetical protein
MTRIKKGRRNLVQKQYPANNKLWHTPLILDHLPNLCSWPTATAMNRPDEATEIPFANPWVCVQQHNRHIKRAETKGEENFAIGGRQNALSRCGEGLLGGGGGVPLEAYCRLVQTCAEIAWSTKTEHILQRAPSRKEEALYNVTTRRKDEGTEH